MVLCVLLSLRLEKMHSFKLFFFSGKRKLSNEDEVKQNKRHSGIDFDSEGQPRSLDQGHPSAVGTQPVASDDGQKNGNRGIMCVIASVTE